MLTDADVGTPGRACRIRPGDGRAGGRANWGAKIVEDRVRVVIAEDSVLLREGLTRLLTDRGHDVVAGVGDGEALIKTITDLADAGRAAGRGGRGRPDAADPHRRGRAGRGAAAPGRTRASGCWCCRSTWRSSTPPSCWPGSSRGVGYLLKDRVAEVREFVDAVVRVAQGGTALDPEVVAQLLGRSRKQDVLAG